MMGESWKSRVRRIAQSPAVERVTGSLVRLILRLNPEMGARISSERWGRANDAVFPLAIGEDVDELLRGIPSETSLRERRFLYRFFSTMWSGQNDVIEIGPFLGGTTRAIALGMSDNPMAAENAKLRTFDRFYGYYDPRSLIKFVDPLVKTGVLELSDLDSLGGSADFMRIFERIHAGYDYYQRVIPCNMMAPDRPEDLQRGSDLLRIPEESLVSAAFVDGCKSWYGTKYFMREVARAATSGTHFIFQDYCWYTCFWIPAFVELLREDFQLIGYVDTTYAFSLTRTLSSEGLERRFPDSPSELGEERLAEIFDRLVEDAAHRNDYFAVVRHTLQKAGAIAYVGNKSRAWEIIATLAKKPWASGHRAVISAALESPTYTPDGRVFLK
jgi:hypothetical protein